MLARLFAMIIVVWLGYSSAMAAETAESVPSTGFSAVDSSVSELPRAFSIRALPRQLLPTARSNEYSDGYQAGRGVFRAGRVVGLLGIPVLLGGGIAAAYGAFRGPWSQDGNVLVDRGMATVGVAVGMFTVGGLVAQIGMAYTAGSAIKVNRSVLVNDWVLPGVASMVVGIVASIAFFASGFDGYYNPLAVPFVIVGFGASWIFAEFQQGANRKHWNAPGVVRNGSHPLRIKVVANGLVGVF